MRVWERAFLFLAEPRGNVAVISTPVCWLAGVPFGVQWTMKLRASIAPYLYNSRSMRLPPGFGIREPIVVTRLTLCCSGRGGRSLPTYLLLFSPRQSAECTTAIPSRALGFTPPDPTAILFEVLAP